VGAGFSYDDSGPTHHLFEDIAVMRALPNITIYSITDNIMARKVAEISLNIKKPIYVRLERHVEPDIYNRATDFSTGYSILREGSDGYIISTGIMVRQSLKLVDMLKRKGISLGVIDIYTIPCNEKLFINDIKKTPRLITIEESFLPGGMGSYVLEILSDNNTHINVKRFGLKPSWCYRYGGREDNRAYHGLDEKTLVEKINKWIHKS
jgi:transketolase